MTTKPDDFSLDRLARMFRQARGAGYSSPVFGEEDRSEGPLVLWRHDIDLDLASCIPVAEIEAREGIRASYFLMVRSRFYNLLSFEGERTTRRLTDLGHVLGLHCDLAVARDAEVSAAEVEDTVRRDLEIIEIRHPRRFSRLVSFHNPPRSVLRRDFAGFYSTYQPKFFSTIKYLSDSNRRWRDGPPEGWFDASLHPRLSILLHPECWTYAGRTMSEGMQQYLDSERARRTEMLRDDDVEV